MGHPLLRPLRPEPQRYPQVRHGLQLILCRLMATSGIASQVLRRVERDPGVLSPLN